MILANRFGIHLCKVAQGTKISDEMMYDLLKT